MVKRAGKSARRTARPRSQAELTPVQLVILGLRALMETAIVLGLAYWGYQTGSTTAMKIVLAVGGPLLLFGFWGAVDFHQAGRVGETLRLAQELLISGIAALALWNAAQPTLGGLLALLSVVYHVLVYASGGRLLHSAVNTVGQ